MNKQQRKLLAVIADPIEFISRLKIIGKDGKLVKDSDGNKIITSYTPKQFCGSVIVDDNNDGTFTCTRLHVYKEEFLVDSDINITKVTSK